MKRIEFIQRLIASGFLSGLFFNASGKDKKPLRYLYSGSVAGLPYYDFHAWCRHIAHNDRAELRLEPDNPYDHRAIEVFWNGRKMGYIPRRDNRVLYNLMKDGAELKAQIRLQRARNWGEDEVISKEDFGYAHDLRIRVYERLAS